MREIEDLDNRGLGAEFVRACSYGLACDGMSPSPLISAPTTNVPLAVSSTVAGGSGRKSFDNVPIWVAVEVLPFGSIAKMLMYLTNDLPAREVAASYPMAWECFQSTIYSFSVLRNQCAHHGQIWHRRPSIQTPVGRKFRPRDVNYDHYGIYPAIIVLKLYLARIQPEGTWAEEIDSLLQSNSALRVGIFEPFAK